MIWQNPWAWLGLVAVALPVIIHLFGRGHARVHRFPTLRFIAASRLLPTRRSRLNDLLLLATRAGALIVAAAALAQPLWLTSHRSNAANRALARAVIVDTSASMMRAVAGTAVDSARRASRALAAAATASTVVETADPAAALPGAVAWLETQPVRGELVLLSDFQLGTLDSVDIASIPPRIGIRLVRIPSSPGPIEMRTRSSEGEATVRVAPSADRTDIEWSSARPASGPNRAPLVLASANEQRRADAARAAAGSLPIALPFDSAATIAVVEPAYDGRAQLLSRATPPRAPWMMDAVARIAADPALAAAARTATIVSSPDSAGMVVVARADNGRPVILAAEGSVEGRQRLLLVSLADPGSVTSAALFSAVMRATSLGTRPQELDSASTPDHVIAQWQRAPAVEIRPRGAGADGAADGESDGRWLWIAVLALLALELWMRRERRVAPPSDEIAHDRAA